MRAEVTVVGLETEEADEPIATEDLVGGVAAVEALVDAGVALAESGAHVAAGLHARDGQAGHRGEDEHTNP